jgi:hypothetical protein
MVSALHLGRALHSCRNKHKPESEREDFTKASLLLKVTNNNSALC